MPNSHFRVSIPKLLISNMLRTTLLSTKIKSPNSSSVPSYRAMKKGNKDKVETFRFQNKGKRKLQTSRRRNGKGKLGQQK